MTSLSDIFYRDKSSLSFFYRYCNTFRIKKSRKTLRDFNSLFHFAPILAIKRAELDGLGDVFRSDQLALLEVGYRP